MISFDLFVVAVLTLSMLACLHGKEKVKPRGSRAPLIPIYSRKSAMHWTIWSKSWKNKKKHENFTCSPINWVLTRSIKCSLEVTSSPVPCMISKGMAKILLYICTDLLLPLLILTSRTLKFVPPRSRARNFPLSVREVFHFGASCQSECHTLPHICRNTAPCGICIYAPTSLG